MNTDRYLLLEDKLDQSGKAVVSDPPLEWRRHLVCSRESWILFREESPRRGYVLACMSGHDVEGSASDWCSQSNQRAALPVLEVVPKVRGSLGGPLEEPNFETLVADYKKQLEAFIAAECNPMVDPIDIRRAFFVRFARTVQNEFSGGVDVNWWIMPVQTTYEPDRKVGIVYQRRLGSSEDMTKRRPELLDRSSLYSVDSFFNVMRQRVSYFHRAGMSRSSQTFYNPFQPYRPEMVQKILDIACVYFNWVEPRPFAGPGPHGAEADPTPDQPSSSGCRSCRKGPPPPARGFLHTGDAPGPSEEPLQARDHSVRRLAQPATWPGPKNSSREPS